MSSQRKEKKDIQEEIENIDSLIANVPLVLDINDPDVIEVGNFYLPRSTGFEMEFDNDGELTKEMFNGITLLDLDINSSEQRFRIPKGIEGLQSLFQISQVLRKNAIFSDYSGIHYHIDATDFFDDIYLQVLEDHQDYIFSELENWKYTGTYNTMGYSAGNLYGLPQNKSYNQYETNIRLGSWIRFQRSFKTLEYRIGNMTFEYPELFQRITHANQLTEYIMLQNTRYKILKENPILLYEDDEDIENVLKSRKKII